MIDATEIGVIIAGQVITAVSIVAVIRTDVKWLKRWAESHESNDEKRFETERNERHDLADEVQEDRNRITALETLAGMRR